MSVQPLKVLIIGLHYAPETTGNAPYTTALASGLRGQGIAVRVITGHPHYPEWRVREGYGQWKRQETVRGVPVTRLRSYIPSRPTTLKRLVAELSFGFRAFFTRWGRPDVVLLVSPAMFSSAVVTLRVKLSPRQPASGVWVQDLYSLGVAETKASGDRVGRVVTALESFVLRSATGVAVIHDRFRRVAETRLEVQSDRVEVIRNWSHLKEPKPINRDAVRQRHGWEADEIIVLHAGNMGVKQGLANVVEAARHADRGQERIRFVLLGDGNQRDSLKELGRGVKRLQFIDPLADEDFQAALASADVLLVNELIGVSEMSVPSKLTSYYSTGHPVLAATDSGSVTASEIELSGGGIVVTPGDPAALLRASVELGRDEAASARLGHAGQQFRLQHLSESEALRRYSTWLRSLAEAKKHASRRDDPTLVRRRRPADHRR